MWLIFDTIGDCISFSAVSAGVSAGTGNASDALSSLSETFGSLSDIADDVNQLMQAPESLTNLAVLADTSPENAAKGWDQVDAAQLLPGGVTSPRCHRSSTPCVSASATSGCRTAGPHALRRHTAARDSTRPPKQGSLGRRAA
jgi:hypothetical protein